MRKLAALPLAALAIAACADGPTATSATTDDAAPASAAIVITPGAAAPAAAPRTGKPLLSLVAGSVGSTAVGSSSNKLPLTPASCSATAVGTVTATFRITGAQAATSTFKVNTRASYNGTTWQYSDPQTLTANGPRTGQTAAQDIPVTITIENLSADGAGEIVPNVVITPFDVFNPNATGAKLDPGAPATIFVEFVNCAVTNTAPTLTLPGDITMEATSSAGVAVTFTVTASDIQDGDLTSSVACTPASGSTFPLGTTTVNCSVTDLGGLTTTGSFTVTVVDTTPPVFTSFPTGTINLIAANINGATLDIGALGITVADVGGVSEPSTFSCDYVAGTVLAIGSTTTVSCTAKDARNNVSAARTFDVFVGLNVSGTGFLSPLRMAAPYSAHKRGSTIPHKFLAPTYADGTPATDLAADLRLVVNRLDGIVEVSSVEANDYATGSTEWRYDATAGHYIFNLKTGTSSPWDPGTWKTTVSYKGIVLATTQFDLKK